MPVRERANSRALLARIAELERQLATKPPIDRDSLYRMTDLAPWGVLSMDSDLRLNYANPAAGRWMTLAPPATGAQIETAIHAPLWQMLSTIVPRAIAGAFYTGEHDCPDASGEPRSLRVIVAPRTSGSDAVTGCVVNLHDLTEARALDAAVRENETRLRLAVEAGRLAVWEFDVAAGRLVGNDQLYRLLGYPSGSTPSAEEINAGYDRSDWARMAQAGREALERGSSSLESELRHTGPDGVLRTLLVRLEMLRNESGAIYKGHGVVIDISERKRAELHQQLLINELNHRVKNTLATVQSIVQQSLRGARSPRIQQDIEARLLALADAHDVLTGKNWEGADLSEVVARSLKAVPPARISADGSAVSLTPRQALSLAMALHELLTNAFKHGAFSSPGGRVLVSWGSGQFETAGFFLHWQETGGPRVAPPQAAGFGSRLLQRSLAAELGGTVTLDFAPAGVKCRIEGPLHGAR